MKQYVETPVDVYNCAGNEPRFRARKNTRQQNKQLHQLREKIETLEQSAGITPCNKLRMYPK